MPLTCQAYTGYIPDAPAVPVAPAVVPTTLSASFAATMTTDSTPDQLLADDGFTGAVCTAVRTAATAATATPRPPRPLTCMWKKAPWTHRPPSAEMAGAVTKGCA